MFKAEQQKIEPVLFIAKIAFAKRLYFGVLGKKQIKMGES